MQKVPWPPVCSLVLALAACTPSKAYLGEFTGEAGSETAAETTGSSAGDSTGEASTGEPTTGGALLSPCKPVDGNTCPIGYVCCSDDPATAGGRKPNYYKDGLVDEKYGAPLFSDANNDLSHWGRCIDVGEFTSPLTNGCPVPCNPTWPAGTTAEICGAASCCPFTAVDPDTDCVLDPETNRWRTVRGADIVAGLTAWGGAHATGQDPWAQGCQVLAAGDQNALVDCISQLSVADQRGYCYALECPCHEDVCDMKNPDWQPRCP